MGFYHRNHFTPESDIDLLLHFAPEGETFDNFMAAWDFLEAIFAPEKVDVVTYKGLSPHIGPHILNSISYA